MKEVAWENPQPLGQGRAESLKAVMLAMKEGKEYTDEETAAMREMWPKVLSGEKKLADFGYLVDRTEPPAAEAIPDPTPEQERAENGDLFNVTAE